MANLVSKFTVGGVEIDVKDTYARAGVAENETNIHYLENRVDPMEDMVAQHQADIAFIKTRLNNSLLKPMSVLVIGDSYLAGSGLPSPTVSNWGEQVRTRLELYNGSTFYSYAGAGYGFNKDADYNFSKLVQQAVSELTEVQRGNITHIIIGGGANDWSNTSEHQLNIISSFNAIKNLINNNFSSDVRVSVVAMGWNCIYPRRVQLPEVYSLYAKLCATSGWSYYECYQVLQNKAYFNEDGVHPSGVGQTAIATCVVNFLLGSSFPVNDGNKKVPIYINNDVVGYAIVSGNNVVLQFYRVTVNNANTPEACNVNQSMGVLSCSVLLGGKSSENNCYFTIPVILNEGTDDICTNAEISIRKPTAEEDIGRDTPLSFVVRIRGVADNPLLNSITPLGSMITIPFPVA